MGSKGMKTKDRTNIQAATVSGVRAGDFPLGSPESRAAARAMLSRFQKLSQYDADCLRVYQVTGWLTAGMNPNYHDVEHTAFYKRGSELHDMLYGPVIPYHLNAKAQRANRASIAFESIHGREPVVGDILRYEEVERANSPELYESVVKDFEKAWKRRLPDLRFPFRCEDGKLYRRCRGHGVTATWEEDQEIQARWRWYGIEAEAVGMWSVPRPPDPPGVRAVVFIESPDLKHRTKPLVEEPGAKGNKLSVRTSWPAERD
jgi:hypothetical protein